MFQRGNIIDLQLFPQYIIHLGDGDVELSGDGVLGALKTDRLELV